MATQPLWRRVFDSVERPVGARLERMVQTEGFADVAATLTKWQAESRRRFERLTRRALHWGNLPAATDVKRVEERLAGVERRLRDLSKQVDQFGEEK
jgi:hypothetical protein